MKEVLAFDAADDDLLEALVEHRNFVGIEREVVGRSDLDVRSGRVVAARVRDHEFLDGEAAGDRIRMGGVEHRLHESLTRRRYRDAGGERVAAAAVRDREAGDRAAGADDRGGGRRVVRCSRQPSAGQGDHRGIIGRVVRAAIDDVNRRHLTVLHHGCREGPLPGRVDDHQRRGRVATATPELCGVEADEPAILDNRLRPRPRARETDLRVHLHRLKLDRAAATRLVEVDIHLDVVGCELYVAGADGDLPALVDDLAGYGIAVVDRYRLGRILPERTSLIIERLLGGSQFDRTTERRDRDVAIDRGDAPDAAVLADPQTVLLEEVHATAAGNLCHEGLDVTLKRLERIANAGPRNGDQRATDRTDVHAVHRRAVGRGRGARRRVHDPAETVGADCHLGRLAIAVARIRDPQARDRAVVTHDRGCGRQPLDLDFRR